MEGQTFALICGPAGWIAGLRAEACTRPRAAKPGDPLPREKHPQRKPGEGVGGKISG